MPITVFRHSHGGPEELNEKFKELFKECDIVVVECAHKEDCNDYKKYLNQLSQIGYSFDVFQSLHDEFLEKLHEFIRNSKKQIEVEESPISSEEYMKTHLLFGNSINAFLNGKLKDACIDFLACCKSTAKFSKKRDTYLAEQLIKLQRENENKKILLTIGSMHLVYYELKRRGIEAKQEFPYYPYTFPLYDELRRRIMFGKPYTMELVAQSIVEIGIFDYLKDLCLSCNEATKKARKIAEKLSYDEINDLSKYISKDNYRKIVWKETIISWLKKKGYKIF
jgi:hypothetical protein